MSNKKLENRLAEKWIKNLKLQVKEAGEHINIFKIHGHKYQRRGISDWLACYNGRFIAIEFKIEYEIVDDYQNEFLNLTILSKGTAIVIRFIKTGSSSYQGQELLTLKKNDITVMWPY